MAEWRVDHGIARSVWESWPESDRAEVEAVLARRAECCPKCGVHPSSMGTQDEPVPVEFHCRVCKNISDAHEKQAKERQQNPSFMAGRSLMMKPKWASSEYLAAGGMLG